MSLNYIMRSIVMGGGAERYTEPATNALKQRMEFSYPGVAYKISEPYRREDGKWQIDATKI